MWWWWFVYGLLVCWEKIWLKTDFLNVLFAKEKGQGGSILWKSRTHDVHARNSQLIGKWSNDKLLKCVMSLRPFVIVARPKSRILAILDNLLLSFLIFFLVGSWRTLAYIFAIISTLSISLYGAAAAANSLNQTLQCIFFIIIEVVERVLREKISVI